MTTRAAAGIGGEAMQGVRSFAWGRPGWEWRVPMALTLVALAVRLALIFRLEVNSDEPQHLHLIYGWLAGEWPYRDRFDNHTPLFHAAFIPFARWIGETPEIVVWARLANLPAGLAAVWLFYRLARGLTNAVAAAWATALSLVLADWSLKMLEFRPDVLWTALWFCALGCFAGCAGGGNAVGFFLGGVSMGAALAVSIKTLLLLPALAIGWLGAWTISAAFRAAFPARRVLKCAIAGLTGFIVIPAGIVAVFAAMGGLNAMWVGLFEVNQGSVAGWRKAMALAILAGGALGARWLSREDGIRRGVRAAVLFAAIAYVALVVGWSPSLKKQTFLPAYPILFLGGWCLAERLMRGRTGSNARLAAAGLTVWAGLLMQAVLQSRPWQDGTRWHRALLRDVLVLTEPSDTVMDLKGETVFRRRPIHMVYVLATGRALASGRVADDDPEKLRSSGTKVAVASGTGFPAVLRSFLKDHYVPVGEGWVRVAGQVIKPTWKNGRWVAPVDLVAPGDYALMRDGRVEEVRTFERAGAQEVDLGLDRRRGILLWKRAVDAGYGPAISEYAPDAPP